MPNMSLKKNEMPSQAPDVRNKNFSEVALGYSEEQAVDEAQRCLHCKHKPCVGGCPVQIDIPAFIAKVAARDFEGAYEVLSASSSLPAVCGRVCPQETQCEAKCVRVILPKKATTSPFSKRYILLEACWFTEFRNSVCPRPSYKRKSIR